MKNALNGAKHVGRLTLRYVDLGQSQRVAIIDDFFQRFNGRNTIDYNGKDCLTFTFCIEGPIPWYMESYLYKWNEYLAHISFIPYGDTEDMFKVEPGYMVISRSIENAEISDVLYYFFNHYGKKNAIKIEGGKLFLKMKLYDGFRGQDEVLKISDCDIVCYEGIDEDGSSMRTIETFEIIPEENNPQKNLEKTETLEETAEPNESAETKELAEPDESADTDEPANDDENVEAEEPEKPDENTESEEPAEPDENVGIEKPLESEKGVESEDSKPTPDSESVLETTLQAFAEKSRSYEEFVRNVCKWIRYKKEDVFVGISKLERSELDWPTMMKKVESCNTTDRNLLPTAISNKCKQIGMGKVRFKTFMLKMFKYKTFDFAATQRAIAVFGNNKRIKWIQELADVLDASLKFESKVRKMMWNIGKETEAFSGDTRETIIKMVVDAITPEEINYNLFVCNPSFADSRNRAITLLDSMVNAYNESKGGTERIEISEFLLNIKLAIENIC